LFGSKEEKKNSSLESLSQLSFFLFAKNKSFNGNYLFIFILGFFFFFPNLFFPPFFLRFLHFFVCFSFLGRKKKEKENVWRGVF